MQKIQAPHPWETATNITNKILEWNLRQNQKLQQQQQQSPDLSQVSPQSTQSIFKTQHNFASLEPQLFLEQYQPDSELWQYNPNLQLCRTSQQPQQQPVLTQLPSPLVYQVQLPPPTQVQPPFVLPENKFLQQYPQLLHLMAN
jgi:hypothetical protein